MKVYVKVELGVQDLDDYRLAAGWGDDPVQQTDNGFYFRSKRRSKIIFLEHRAEGFIKRKQIVLDLFGSRDGEGLAWLRSKWANIDERTPDFERKILLIHGDSCDVSAPVDTVNVSKLRMDHFKKYDLLISSAPLYASVDDEFTQVNTITDLLYRRLTWQKIIYVVVREASNLYYSRLRVSKSQVNAKAEMIYLIREARHMGMARARIRHPQIYLNRP